MKNEQKQHKHVILRSCIKWSLYASISIWLGVTVFDQIEKHINISFWGHIGAEKERQLSCIKDMYYMFVTKKITDYSAHEWQRDELYTFRSQEGALYKKGTIFVKYLRGLPGDPLEINDKHEIMVNGKVVASGFPIFERHGIRVPEKFIFKETIPPHKYYMLGDTEHSYDSRYRGYVDEEDITLTEEEIIRTYARRWSIEVSFYNQKQFLRLESCCANQYGSIIAHTTMVCVCTMMLEFIRRYEKDVRSFGAVFESCAEQLEEIHLNIALDTLMNTFMGYVQALRDRKYLKKSCYEKAMVLAFKMLSSWFTEQIAYIQDFVLGLYEEFATKKTPKLS